MKHWLRLFLLFQLFPAVSLAHLSPPQIISLVPPGAIEVLESENTAGNQCISEKKVGESFEKCKSEKLTQLKNKSNNVWEISLYENPSLSGKKLGRIQIRATPAVGLEASFFDMNGKKVALESESSNSDWSSGNYFQFTVSDVRGDWVQLPRGSFGTPVWMNLQNDWKMMKSPHPETLQTDSVYKSPLGDIVIVKFLKSDFSYRMENENDSPCMEEPKIIPPEKMRTTTQPIDRLFDSGGKLKAWIKYTRGC